MDQDSKFYIAAEHFFEATTVLLASLDDMEIRFGDAFALFEAREELRAALEAVQPRGENW